MSLSSFLVHSQSSIEVRQFLRANFIELLISDYTIMEFLFEKTFAIFDRLGIKQS